MIVSANRCEIGSFSMAQKISERFVVRPGNESTGDANADRHLDVVEKSGKCNS